MNSKTAVKRFFRPGFLFSRLVLIACTCLVTQIFAQQTFVQQHGLLSVKGNKIVDKNGTPTTLRGMSLYCWSPAGTQFFNTNAINWLFSDWKCTVIRIAILPSSYQGNPTGEINKVKTVIDACIAKGIYAVVDWHSMEGAQNNVQSSKNFFSAVATAYGSTPNVMYETWNEPVQESWATQIKPYHEAIIQTIRAIDPDNIIICGSRNWDQQVNEASLNPITSSTNIAYSLHFYAATHKQSLRDNASSALKNGIALFASEWGTSEATGNGVFDSTETRRWWNFLDTAGISQANWSLAALGETSAALQPGASANGNWTDANLKPSGKFVRAYIILMNSRTGTIAQKPGPRDLFSFSTPGQNSMAAASTGEMTKAKIFDMAGRRVAGKLRNGKDLSGNVYFIKMNEKGADQSHQVTAGF